MQPPHLRAPVAGRCSDDQTDLGRDLAREPFPEELRAEILRHNPDLLGAENPFSFLNQLDRAVRRRDPVAANNRSAQWIVCYFDALFGANRVLHPGEKRLIEFARAECASTPEGFDRDVITLTRMTSELDVGVAGHLQGMLSRLSAIARA